MNAYPFTVYKRSNRPYFFVSFKDASGKFLSPVSTKKTTEKEAMQIAFEWLRDGVPKKNAALKVCELSLKDMARKIKTDVEAESFLDELKRLGWMKSYVLKETPSAEDFISFLTTFWDWDNSPYIREKLRKSHGIHKRHCKLQKQAVSLYWEKFFKGRFLGEISAADIDAFIDRMGDEAVSASRKNAVIKAGTKPLRWAFSKGKIDKDPTRGHILFTGEKRKRQILTPTAAAAVFKIVWENDRARLANMLASVTGMRSGEILALRFQDIGYDCLYVRGAWNREDGMKLPKNNKTRTVEMPFPFIVNCLIEQAKQNPWGFSPDSFVFWSEFHADKPMQPDLFLIGLREALTQIGFSKDEAAKYLFHGWRHFFTSYMVRKLDKKLIKSQTGHLTDEMIELYSDHEIVGDKELIQAKQLETFADIIPDQPKMLVFKKENPPLAACQ
jgi:integrase